MAISLGIIDKRVKPRTHGTYGALKLVDYSAVQLDNTSQLDMIPNFYVLYVLVVYKRLVC